MPACPWPGSCSGAPARAQEAEEGSSFCLPSRHSSTVLTQPSWPSLSRTGVLGQLAAPYTHSLSPSLKNMEKQVLWSVNNLEKPANCKASQAPREAPGNI